MNFADTTIHAISARTALRVGILLACAPAILGVVAVVAAKIWVTEQADARRAAEVEAAACHEDLRHRVDMAELRRACTMASLSAASEYAALRRDCEVRR